MSLKIAVLLGGTSAERDVSLVSGQEIAKALSQKGHRVEAIDCAYGVQLIENLDRDINEIIKVNPSEIENQRTKLNRNIFKTINYLIREKFDVVYVALHGGYGENGQIQSILDLAGLPYTGSGALASALSMDKNLSKIIFVEHEIPTSYWIKLDTPEEWKTYEHSFESFPVVVKPNDQGSTVGLTVVEKEDEMSKALNIAFNFSASVIVEKYISGREMTVSILGQTALPIVEIVSERGIYDYESKYQKGKSHYVVPAEISDETTEKLQQAALRAYNSLGCRHYARIDFRLREDGEIFCLEVNTLPGMTATSLVPKAAKAVGIDFSNLVEKIVKSAL